MELYQYKKNLENYKEPEIKLLRGYFKLRETNRDKLLWSIAEKIMKNFSKKECFSQSISYFINNDGYKTFLEKQSSENIQNLLQEKNVDKILKKAPALTTQIIVYANIVGRPYFVGNLCQQGNNKIMKINPGVRVIPLFFIDRENSSILIDGRNIRILESNPPQIEAADLGQYSEQDLKQIAKKISKRKILEFLQAMEKENFDDNVFSQVILELSTLELDPPLNGKEIQKVFQFFQEN